MKVTWSWLAASVFVALQTAVWGQMTNATLSVAISSPTTTNSHPSALTQSKLEPVYGGTHYLLVTPKFAITGERHEILKLGRESSQAWTTIANRQPDPSVVHDARTHEPRLCLISFGHQPWR
jgi:hypothetical protein